MAGCCCVPILLTTSTPPTPEPQRNVSIAAVRGAVRPSKKWLVTISKPFIVAVSQEKEHVPRVSSKDSDHPVLLRTLRTVKAIKIADLSLYWSFLILPWKTEGERVRFQGEQLYLF